MQANLRDGDSVVLIDRRGRRYLKRLKSGHRMTIRSTVLACDRLIGLPDGSRVGGDRDEEFHVFLPGYAELVPLFERSAEPIFAKDAGLIITRGDIRPGQTVLEIGAGCGALSMALLRAVGPTGQLVTYEIRENFAAEARRNVERYEGPAPAWTIRIRDASTGLDERDVDRIVIDIPDAISVLAAAADALRDGGILVAFSPTVLQVRDIHDAVFTSGALGYAETYEVLERSWHVDAQSVRPDHRMIAHTGFITIARRLAR
ncbi:MAG TPA: rRNA adenine N-6-methyltransferase family protein [Candidatus Limnocylindrales bacterium]|nr:rRNA adenine N-6-methyltransferase family protein [Candidatus Limnocylindrales bacterium]